MDETRVLLAYVERLEMENASMRAAMMRSMEALEECEKGILKHVVFTVGGNPPNSSSAVNDPSQINGSNTWVQSGMQFTIADYAGRALAELREELLKPRVKRLEL